MKNKILNVHMIIVQKIVLIDRKKTIFFRDCEFFSNIH
jgi:hypothetical protein